MKPLLSLLVLLVTCPAWGQVSADALVQSDLITAPDSAKPGETVIVQLRGDIPYRITPEPKDLIRLRDDDGNRVLLVLNARPPGFEIEVNHAVVHPTEAEIEAAPLDDKAKFLAWLKEHSADEIYRDQHAVEVADSPGPEPQPDPDGPSLTGIARAAYEAAGQVDSPNRSAEAALFAVIFRAVASKAAGVGTMTPAEIFREASTSIKDSIPQDVRDRWDPWKEAWGRYANEKLRTREQVIDGLNDTAKGLEAVKN